MRYNPFVYCKECGEEHLVADVHFLNVEEDISGRDKFYFVCPVTDIETWSFPVPGYDESGIIINRTHKKFT